MNWYYSENNQQKGPVDEAALGELARSGRITQDTLVWREGMTDWTPYRNINPSAAPERVTQATTGQNVRCTECGNYFPADEIISIGNGSVCAACKPLVVQKLKEGVTVTGDYRYGGFWMRVAAKFLDGLILGIFQFALNMILTLMLRPSAVKGSPAILIFTFMLMGLGFCIQAGYSIWFVGKFGATPGKMACGLKVIRPDGGSVGFGLATGRHFAELLSAIIIYIGYIMVAFDDEKRSLHDRICNTRVIYK